MTKATLEEIAEEIAEEFAEFIDPTIPSKLYNFKIGTAAALAILKKHWPSSDAPSAVQLLRQARCWVACPPTCDKYGRGDCVCGAALVSEEIDALLGPLGFAPTAPTKEG